MATEYHEGFINFPLGRRRGLFLYKNLRLKRVLELPEMKIIELL